MWGHKKVRRLLADLPASGPLVHTMGPIRRMPAWPTSALACTVVAGKCFLLAALRPVGLDGGLSNPGALALATAAVLALGVASGRWEYPAGGFVVGWAGGGGSWSGEAAEGGDELESFLAGEARLTVLLVAAEADGSTPAALRLRAKALADATEEGRRLLLLQFARFCLLAAAAAASGGAGMRSGQCLGRGLRRQRQKGT